MLFDWIIRGGTVVDGENKPAFRADVGIRGERIEAVDDLSGAESRYAVEAAGALVTPGFFDVHSHSDTYLLLEPEAPSKLSEGVTTEINGQCGGSAVPRLGPARLSSDWASQVYPERLPDGAVRRAAAPGPTWTTVATYRELFDAVRPAINSIQFIGHNTLRAGVMGYEAKQASPDDLREMARRLEQALDEGGWGLTTGLLYQPGKYSTEGEVTELARVAARKEGIYATHMRSESVRILEAVDEVLRLARATGIQVEISHLKTSGRKNWSKIDALLEKLVAAKTEGINLFSDRYPFVAAGTDLDVVLPDWAIEGGRDAELARLADPVQRARIASELDGSGRDWETVRIGGGWSDLTRGFCGQTLAAAARALGRSPGETVCAFVEADLTRTGAFFFGMSEENLHRIYELPWIMCGSDASVRAPWGVLGRDFPHPRAYSSFSRFFRLLTGRVEGFRRICSREEAIHRLTGLPAKVFGVKDRGVLRKGAFADIAVWHEDAFCGTASYDTPHRFTSGVDAVFVNGVLSYQQGVFTGRRAGRFLSKR